MSKKQVEFIPKNVSEAKFKTFQMLNDDPRVQNLLNAASLALTMWLVSISVVCIGVLIALTILFPDHPFNTGWHVDFVSWLIGIK